MEASINSSTDGMCNICRQSGSDIRVNPCGCTLHSHCVPLTHLVDTVTPDGKIKPVDSKSQTCPICNTTKLCRMEMFSISSEMLDRAVQIRKETEFNRSEYKSKPNTERNTTILKTTEKIPNNTSNIPEASYLMLSSTYDPVEDVLPSSPLWEADFQRTGRWSKEESEYVDFICKAFDDGQLILPSNTRLRDFLCRMLLCKGSRLTKRYKNAKLSLKAYEIKTPAVENRFKCEELSILKERFLSTMTSEAAALEARFNIIFTWNLMFSNFCNEIGYGGVDFNKWNVSIELMGKRATDAEEAIRTFRRKNVNMNLCRSEVKEPEHGGQTCNILPSHSVGRKTPPHTTDATILTKPLMPSRIVDQIQQSISDQSGSELKWKTPPQKNTMNDFAAVFNDADEQISQKSFMAQRYSSSNVEVVSLLRRIIAFMEAQKLPFDSADVWVLSTGPPPESSLKSSVPSLYYGGFATRTDLGSVAESQLRQFGEYSSKFLFPPNGGLPGLVHCTREPQWATNLDDAGPEYFARAAGAKVCGIKTALAVPLFSPTYSCVFVMYSLATLLPDDNITYMVVTEFSRYTLQPKWKFVVDSEVDSNANVVDHHSRSDCTMSQASVESDEEDYFGGNSIRSSRRPEVTSKDNTSSVTLVEDVADGHEVDLQISNLLAENMPLTTSANMTTSSAPSPRSYHFGNQLSTNNMDRQATMDQFISLRLLLLRSPDRRNDSENSVVDIIRQSYRSYRQISRWNDREVSLLLVIDWMHLRSSLR